MASGNFLVGKDLPLEGFDKYILPLLEEKGYSVMDRISVGNKSNKSILVSVAGAGDLEKEINDALVRSRKIIETDENELVKANFGFNQVAWSYQVSEFVAWEDKNDKKVENYIGIYSVLGLYNDDSTASQLFMPIAQSYLLDDLGKKVDGIKNKIKNILGKRLSEI